MKKIVILLLFTINQSFAFQGDSLEAVGVFNNASHLYEKAQFNHAIEKYNEAFSLFNQLGLWDRKLECKNLIMASLINLGSYETALDLLPNLESYIDELGYSKEIASNYNLRGASFFYLGNFESALNSWLKSLEMKKKVFGENHKQIAITTNNIAVLYERMGRYEKALEEYFDLLKFYNNGNDGGQNDLEKAVVFLNIGNVFQYKGNYELAASYFDSCYVIRKEKLGFNDPDVGQVLNNMGNVHRFSGEYDKALNYHLQAKKVIENFRGKTHPEVAKSIGNAGLVYFDKGQFELAKKHHKEALSLKIQNFGEENYDVAISLQDLASVYKQENNLDSALLLIQKSIAIRRKILGENNHEIADALLVKSLIQESEEDLNGSIITLKEALKIYENAFGLHSVKVAEVQLEISKRFYDKDELGLSKTFIQKSFASNISAYEDENFMVNPPLKNFRNADLLLKTFHHKTKLLKSSPQIEEQNLALESFLKCDSLIDIIRMTFLSNDDKTNLGNSSRVIYAEAISLCKQLFDRTKAFDYLEKAYFFSERSRASVLKENTSSREAKLFAGIPKQLTNLESDLKADLSFYKSEELQLYNSEKMDSTKLIFFQSTIFNLTESLDSIIRLYEEKYPTYHSLKYGWKHNPLVSIKNEINRNTTIIEFFQSSDSLVYAFSITEKEVQFLALELDDKFEFNVKGMLSSLEDGDVSAFSSSSYAIYNAIWKPLNIDSEKVILIPDGLLWNINFDILVSSEEGLNAFKDLPYLIKEFDINTIYSNAILDKKRVTNRISNNEKCLAFSIESELPDGSLLDMDAMRDVSINIPGTSQEIHAIAEIMDGSYFYGNNATEANFKKYAPQFKILHLALHGKLDDNEPLNSKFIFSQGKDSIEDNYLHAFELYNMELSSDLAVLSACNSGVGELMNGEGLVSLSRAFSFAGCRSLIFSQWELSDAIAPVIIKDFYENLIEGNEKSTALRLAKIDFLTNSDDLTSNPYYWASLVQLGDNSSIRTQEVRWIWIISFVLIVCLFLVYRRRNYFLS